MRAPFEHPVEARREFRRGGHPLVVGDAVAVVARVLRAAAELPAEEGVGDAVADKRSLEGLGGELREMPRPGRCADVGHGGRAGAPEEAEKRLIGVGGMPDGEDRRGGDIRHGAIRGCR